MAKSLKQEKEMQAEVDKKLVDAFMADFRAVSDKHGLDIGCEMVYTLGGVHPKLVIIKKNKDEGGK